VFFGPGVLELLRGIRETGSIQRAAKGMGLSYVKALKILRQTEDGFGRAFLSRRKGGNERGRSELTEFGGRFLERYEAFCAEAGKELDRRFAAVVEEVFSVAEEEAGS
jgi:molybdate transport repressor ModE-like protein